MTCKKDLKMQMRKSERDEMLVIFKDEMKKDVDSEIIQSVMRNGIRNMFAKAFVKK